MATIAERFVRVRADTSLLKVDITKGYAKLAAAGLTLGAAAGAALFGIGREFDKARDAIIVGTGASGKALAGLQKDFRAVASTTPADMESVGQAIADVNTRLGLTGKPLQDVSKKFLDLSRITKTDLQTNIASITRLFGDWSIKTKDQSATMDKLFKASQATGIGVDKLADQMVQFGSPLRQLGLSFDFTAAMFARFEKEGVNTQTVLPGLKMALKNFAKAGKEPAPALMKTFKAIKNASSTAKANTIAFEIFGARAGPDLAAAIREGRFNLDELIGTMNDSKGAIADAAKRTESFGEKWLKLKNKVFLSLQPLATKVFDGISNGMEKLGQAFGPMLKAFKTGKTTTSGFVGNAEQLGIVARKVFDTLRGAVSVVAGFVRWLKEGSAGAVVLSSVMGGLIAAFLAYKIALIAAATYTKIIAAVTKVWVGIQAALNLVMSANPLALIVLAIVALVAAIVIAYKRSETFRRIVDKAWAGIKVAIKFAWENVIEPVFTVWWAYIKILARVVMWLWRSIIKPAWNGIKLAIKVAWFFINLYIMAWRKIIEKVIAPVIRWLWQKIVAPYFKGIGNTIKFVWTRVIRPIFQALSTFIRNKIAPGFKLGVDAIKRAWDRMKSIAKAPVNFLINPVYMKGIRKVFNTAAKYLGVSQRLPALKRFAAGGVLPGYQPGKDTIPALLSPGEGILRPEVVRALGPEQIYAWNKAAKQKKSIATFADGGIVGFFRNPVGFIKDKVNSKIAGIVSRFGNSNLTRLITALPRKILGNLVTWAKNKISSFFGGAGNVGSPSGSSIASIMRLARMFDSRARMSSGYRPGDPGYHGRGLAADIVGGGGAMARIARGFYGMSGRLLELIHSGGGGFFVKNGRRVGASFYGREVANHWDHIHVAAHRNALGGAIPRNFVADTGTTLMPGWNLRYNGTGRPEPLVPPESRGMTRADFRELVRELKAAGLVLVTTDPNRSIGTRANQLRRA